MLTLSLQAGGQSSRMGQDKALLDFGGQPLIQHLATRLGSAADETIITTNHPEGYRFLNLPLYPDNIPQRGALGGLYTALYAAAHPLVAVVACDLPFASPGILLACRDLLLAHPELDAVLPRTEHGWEPLHAVYRREICLAAVRAALDTDQWKMVGWHDQANVQTLSTETITRLDPKGLAFWNVNTPQEFDRAVQHFISSPFD